MNQRTPTSETARTTAAIAATCAPLAAAADAPAPGDAAFAVTVATAVHPDVDLVATRVTCARTAGTAGCPAALPACSLHPAHDSIEAVCHASCRMETAPLVNCARLWCWLSTPLNMLSAPTLHGGVPAG